MRYFIIMLFALLAAPAIGQKLIIENRDGKAVIVTRDTLPTGETVETVQWKADPTAVLEGQLKDANRLIDWTEQRIQQLQAELKGHQRDKQELEKALDDLSKGIIIDTGKPDDVQPAPATKNASTAPPPKTKKARKKKQ